MAFVSLFFAKCDTSKGNLYDWDWRIKSIGFCLTVGGGERGGILDLVQVKEWVKKDSTIPLYLFNKLSEKHTLEVVDSWTGKIIYKSAHESREDAVDCMCEIKGIDPPNRDDVKRFGGLVTRQTEEQEKRKERRVKTLNLYEQGIGAKEIAQILDVSLSTAKNDLRVLKVVKRRHA